MSVIEVERIAKRFGRREILRDISFRVPAQALIGIQGENGAGKSTLLKCLVGLLKADGGSVRSRGRMGYCPQEPSLLTMLTGREHLDLFGAGMGMPPRDVGNRIGELAETFGCSRYLDTRIDRLSGGTAQKFNLIGSLLNDPALLVLDEPYQGFDYETYTRFWEFTDEFRDGGGSVLVVSHMHSELSRFDAMIDLRDGEAAAHGRLASQVVVA